MLGTVFHRVATYSGFNAVANVVLVHIRGLKKHICGYFKQMMTSVGIMHQ